MINRGIEIDPVLFCFVSYLSWTHCWICIRSRHMLAFMIYLFHSVIDLKLLMFDEDTHSQTGRS